MSTRGAGADLQLCTDVLANVPGKFLAVSEDHCICWQLQVLKDPVIRDNRSTRFVSVKRIGIVQSQHSVALVAQCLFKGE